MGEGDSTQSTKIREIEANRDRMEKDVGEKRRGLVRAGLVFVIVNGRWRAKAAGAAVCFASHSSLNACLLSLRQPAVSPMTAHFSTSSRLVFTTRLKMKIIR